MVISEHVSAVFRGFWLSLRETDHEMLLSVWNSLKATSRLTIAARIWPRAVSSTTFLSSSKPHGGRERPVRWGHRTTTPGAELGFAHLPKGGPILGKSWVAEPTVCFLGRFRSGGSRTLDDCLTTLSSAPPIAPSPFGLGCQ